MKSNITSVLTLISCCVSASLFADVHPTEYKTNIGGDWLTSSTWNVLPSGNTSYPQSYEHAFCVEGASKTLTLNSDISVGRMIGGGGGFANNKIVGTGILTFNTYYDSNSGYDYSASALWGTGEIIYENTGGVYYTTTDDRTSGWSDTVGIKIFLSKNSSYNHTQTYNTKITADVTTSMYGVSAAKSTINFNSTTKLTDFYINNGTVNINNSASFTKVTVNSGSVLNINNTITSGNLAGTGTINFTGDYTQNDGKSVNMGTISTTNSAKVNFNHKGVITTGYNYYENTGNATIAQGATVKIDTTATAGDSWGQKFLFQTGGTAKLTVNGTIDATDYAGSSGAQLIRNWGALVIEDTGVVKGSGKIANYFYMGRASNFTVNGGATISGISYLFVNQTAKTSATIYINDSYALQDIYINAQKDTSANDGTTMDSLTNSNVFVSGDSAIKSFGFANTNDQFTVDLEDCTSLVLGTLFNNGNVNSNAGKLIFTNFKSGIVYIKDTTGLDMLTFNDYVSAEGWNITVDNGYIVGSQIPEPATCAAILAALAIGFVAYRKR